MVLDTNFQKKLFAFSENLLELTVWCLLRHFEYFMEWNGIKCIEKVLSHKGSRYFETIFYRKLFLNSNWRMGCSCNFFFVTSSSEAYREVLFPEWFSIPFFRKSCLHFLKIHSNWRFVVWCLFCHFDCFMEWNGIKRIEKALSHKGSRYFETIFWCKLFLNSNWRIYIVCSCNFCFVTSSSEAYREVLFPE